MSRSAPGIEPSPIIPKHRNGTEHPKEGRSPTVSYALWTVQDLNLRPTGCKPDALPTELTVQKRERHTQPRRRSTPLSKRDQNASRKLRLRRERKNRLRSAAGLEPATSGPPVLCHLSYALWTVQESNLRPSACDADALPSEPTVQKLACLGPAAQTRKLPCGARHSSGSFRADLRSATLPRSRSTHSHRVGLNRRYRAHCVTARIEPAHMRMSAQVTTPVAPLRRRSSPFLPRPPRTRRLVVISH